MPVPVGSADGRMSAVEPTTALAQGDLIARRTEVEAIMKGIQRKMSIVQSRFFEMQELRHDSRLPSDWSVSPLLFIDTLVVEISAMLPALQAGVSSIVAGDRDKVGLQDDYTDLDDRWHSLIADLDELREELREDQWLGHLRTAADQATEMMASLERAMIHMQDTINRVKLLQHRNIEAWRDSASVSDISLADFGISLRSFESKTASYRPSVEQLLSNIDKGARERATRNGEALRRHADLLSRWRDLTDRIGRLEIESNSAHLWLLARSPPQHPGSLPPRPHGAREPSSSTQTDEICSSQSSQTSLSSRVKTPPVEAKGRRSSVASSLSRSKSPFNRMLGNAIGKMSDFSLMGSKIGSNAPTGDSSSVAASSSPRSSRSNTGAGKLSVPASRKPYREAASKHPSVTTPLRPRWNGSVTRLEDIPLLEPRVIGRRTSSSMLSQSASSASNGWYLSPSASQPALLARGSTPTPEERPPSQSIARPPTPSMIPRPGSRNAISPTASNRLPTHSASRTDLTPSRLPRPSSRNGYDNPRSSSSLSNYSNAPLDTLTSPSRPTHHMSKSSSMTLLDHDDSSTSFRLQPSFPGNGQSKFPPSPFYRGRLRSPELGSPSGSDLGYSARNRPSLPSLSSRGFLSSSTSSLGLSPPSSFRHAPVVPRSPSHGSLGLIGSISTASLSYKPNRFNLLDLEIARIVNGGTTFIKAVERVDPLPRGQAAAAVDLNTAQYRFMSPRGDEKVYNCKALELHRGRQSSAIQSDVKVVKVMIRVGGGWLDLEVHLAKLFAF